MLFQTVADVVAQAIPDPAPSAPGRFVEKWSLVIAVVKWISLGIAMVVLSGSGAFLFAESRGMGSGVSPELKSKLGQVVLVLVIVGSAAQIIQFFS
jgi:hypothetical protein